MLKLMIFWQLKMEYAVKEKYLRDYCASANYIMIILLEGYKFNQTWENIYFQRQVCAYQYLSIQRCTFPLPSPTINPFSTQFKFQINYLYVCDDHMIK